MVDICTEIIIDASPDRVSEYAANPDHATAWYLNIKSVEWKTPKPLRIGSQIEFRASFLGKKLVYTYEITRYIPGEILVMSTANGPFPMQTTYEWSAKEDGGTLMKLRNRGEPKGFSKLVSPMMRSSMKKANQKDLLLLKSILES